jgi:predicted regulator of Ras-like GTPase activity (Roadblock/LC7/MglB family)
MAGHPGGGEHHSAKAFSKDDQALRDQQLQFYSGDVKRLNAVLDAFLKKSNAKCAFLITTGGHTVTKVGQVQGLDTDTIAALTSGAFAATKKLFEVFKEKDFALTVQKGKKESVYIGLVGGRCLFTVDFDDTTTQGAVQLYASETTKKLEEIFAAIARGEGAAAGADEKISESFGSESGGALDSVFGS